MWRLQTDLAPYQIALRGMQPEICRFDHCWDDWPCCVTDDLLPSPVHELLPRHFPPIRPERWLDKRLVILRRVWRIGRRCQIGGAIRLVGESACDRERDRRLANSRILVLHHFGISIRSAATGRGRSISRLPGWTMKPTMLTLGLLWSGGVGQGGFPAVPAACRPRAACGRRPERTAWHRPITSSPKI